MNNEYNYRLQLELPDVEFDDDVAAALDDLDDFVAEGHDGEGIQGEIYETARRHDLEVSEFFEAGYRLFFYKMQGPGSASFWANWNGTSSFSGSTKRGECPGTARSMTAGIR